MRPMRRKRDEFQEKRRDETYHLDTWEIRKEKLRRREEIRKEDMAKQRPVSLKHLDEMR